MRCVNAKSVVPNLFDPEGTFVIPTQNGGHDYKMATVGGGAYHKMATMGVELHTQTQT